MSYVVILIKDLDFSQKVAHAVSVFVMASCFAGHCKADVSTPRIGESSSFLAMAAISILVAVIGLIMIIRRHR